MANKKKKASFWEKYGLAVIIGGLFIAFILIYALVPKNNKENTGGSDIKTIAVADWKEEIKKDKSIVTVLAQTTCSYCNEFKPIAKQVANEDKVTIYWFDIDTLSEADNSTLTSSFDTVEKNFQGTPYTFITKSNKLIGDISGYVELDQFRTQLKTYGVLK